MTVGDLIRTLNKCNNDSIIKISEEDETVYIESY